MQPELAYAVLEIPDPSALDDTFADIIGLQRGAQQLNSVYHVGTQ